MTKEAEGSGGGVFSALVNRKSNAGPAAEWDGVKIGKGITVTGPNVSKTGDGWSAVKLGMLYQVKKDATDKNGPWDTFDCLLDFKSLPGPCFVGVCNNNYDPTTNPTASTGAVIFSSVDGEVFAKKVSQAPATKMMKLSAGDTFQMELRMKHAEASFNILGADEKLKATCRVPVELTVATLMVAFGPVEGEGAFEVVLSGQSCELSLENDMLANMTESYESKMAGDATNAAAMAMA